MNCHFLSILILIQVRIRFWVCLDSYQIRICRLKIRENIWWARYFSQKSCGSFRCGSQWGSWLQRVCDGTGPIQVWIFSLVLILDLNFTKYLSKKIVKTQWTIIVCLNFSGLQWDSEDRRLEFLFRMYDLDRDGFISNGELFQVKVAWS